MTTASTTQFRHLPDLDLQARRRLLSAWDRPKIRAWIKALAAGAQLLENVNFDLIVSSELEVATGDALDQWGELVVEQRLGLSDNDYRRFILARMLVNRSDGTIDSLIEILEVAAAPTVDVWHLDNFPAGFYLVVDRQQFLSDAMRRRVARLMADAEPAGRHMTIVENVVDGFGWVDSDSSEGFGVGPMSRLIA